MAVHKEKKTNQDYFHIIKASHNCAAPELQQNGN